MTELERIATGVLKGTINANPDNVCQAWKAHPAAFAAWAVANGYAPGKKLYRMDTARNYAPENCFFSSAKPAAAPTHYIEHNGKRQSAAEWARETGIPYDTLISRIKAGWTNAQALGEEERRSPSEVFITYGGRSQSLTEWSRETGIPYDTLYGRWCTGKKPAEILKKGHLKTGRGAKHYLTADGRTQSWAAWSRETGISYETIRGRVCAGWPDHKVLGLPE